MKFPSKFQEGPGLMDFEGFPNYSASKIAGPDGFQKMCLGFLRNQFQNLSTSSRNNASKFFWSHFGLGSLIIPILWDF